MIPKFLQPEVLPYASIEIVRARFRSFLTDPATGPRLDAMLADNRATDAAIEAERNDDRGDEDCGSTCGAACGFCGRCS
jgi:hypothetical protein